MASTSVSSSGSYGTVSVGVSAVPIAAAKSLRKSILIQNVHATNVLYVGFNASVATSTGTRLSPGDSLTLDDYNGSVYGIASAASTDVRYLEIG